MVPVDTRSHALCDSKQEPRRALTEPTVGLRLAVPRTIAAPVLHLLLVRPGVSRMTKHSLSWVGPLSLGAALMYLFDPVGGNRRRALVRDQVAHAARRAREASRAVTTDLDNRLAGLRARLTSGVDALPVDDAVLEARVRSKLGRTSAHAGAIGVASIDGVVTLTGPVLAHVHGTVCRAVERVNGVVAVIDYLTEHEHAGSVPGLQGEGSVGTRSEGWSPRTRMAAVAGGATLIAYGLQQRTLAGGVAASLGAGLLSLGLAGIDIAARASEWMNAIEPRRQFQAIDVEAGERGMLGV